MGSLDAYLVAGAFRIFGEHVWAIRLVQTALYAAFLATSYAVALRFTTDRRTALVATLLLALPPVLLVLYTTASLGGYGEALVAGNLLLWWGHRLGSDTGKRWCLWLGWGLVAGVGFWALGLVLVYIVPVAVWLVWHLRRRAWRGYLLAALGFVFGGLPWWLGNRGHVDIGVAELLGTAVRSSATAGTPLGNVAARLFNFVVLGLPALLGLRFPWSVKGPPLWLAVPVVALYLGAVLHSLRLILPRLSTTSLPTPLPPTTPASRSPHRILWGTCVTLFLGFVLTPFGGDPSGRYFLPLYVPLAIFTADALAALRARTRSWVSALLGVVLAFNLIGTVQAASTNPPGITTQFEAITQVDHRYDDELIDFLRAHNGTRGYTNYWVAYPIAFLSEEKIILVPRLPYKADLQYTARDDRYAPYETQVEASPTVVYVTTNHSSLDEVLREQLTAVGVDFSEVQIGDYHVLYDLSRRVTPEELALPVKE
jgi:4-amino-4-deoxy-L-arabinose transferase-like glycosyltransferase